MAIRIAERSRELHYSYAQATRNWLTSNDQRSRPEGLIELGVLLGDGLRNSLSSNASELAPPTRGELFRTWIQTTAKLLHAIEFLSVADPSNHLTIPSSQHRLEELFHHFQRQFESLDGPHVLQPHKPTLNRQFMLAEEAESP
jgi:hypothetical protein